jgi:hypothetical protein
LNFRSVEPGSARARGRRNVWGGSPLLAKKSKKDKKKDKKNKKKK